jgi:hypothetical protein
LVYLGEEDDLPASDKKTEALTEQPVEERTQTYDRENKMGT